MTRPAALRAQTVEALTSTTASDGSSLGRRIDFEIMNAGDRAMRALHPDLYRREDLRELYWCRLDDGALAATVRECHVLDGTVAAWVERLGLVDDRKPPYDLPGYVRYAGTVDGINVTIGGITDQATWDNARRARRRPAGLSDATD